ncbi:hypothetical protein TREMEDRAFT_35088, partial [Tremella mesenterica DSM 1558]|uniref:uncharacterized protein n=1 Tax=Tremella mesenterica (strain ATCC 24925 / CBS 8224 / DSM 1558 / NBRC 9311 / NRRL Y-6157 / RJB 2259-6 / UBC 559-6) TaxID=578456 RepID=UPI00032C7E72
EGTSVSSQTVKQVAEQNGYHKQVKEKKPQLPPATVEQRKEWAEDNKERDWKCEIWTDETTVEKFNPKHFTVNFHGTRVVVHVWGAITFDHKRPLFCKPVEIVKKPGGGTQTVSLNTRKYIDLILRPLLHVYAVQLEEENGWETLIMVDGHPAHRAGETRVVEPELGLKRVTRTN